MFERAVKALSFGLCDRCLGRLFAKAGFGLTNSERGSSIRTVLGMAVDGPDITEEVRGIAGSLPVHNRDSYEKRSAKAEEAAYPDLTWNETSTGSLPTPWTDGSDTGKCWLCEDIFSDIGRMRDLVEENASSHEFDSFIVGTNLEASMAYREQRVWEAIEPDQAEPLKEEYNRELGKLLFEIWPEKGFDRDSPEVTFIVDPVYRRVHLQIKPIFISGRYRKLVRGIPQTRWPCRECKGSGCDRCSGTGKRYPDSVEECIGRHASQAFQAPGYKLHGMGREDIDVVTLGNGRPFSLEISSPKARKIDLEMVRRESNEREGEKVTVSELVITSRASVKELKESRALKRYRASITLHPVQDEQKVKYGISLLGRSPIHQRTPERVSHRRADIYRDRKVHEVDATFEKDGSVTVTVLADAGLYIKELLHGDGGRTEPSLASLLSCQVEVHTLDVLEVLDAR